MNKQEQNKLNLVPISSRPREEQTAIGRRGGLASAAAKKEHKRIAAALREVLDEPVAQGSDITRLEAIALKAIKRLYDKPTIGDVKVLADILGESVQNLNLATNETIVSVEVRNATTKRNLERAIREVLKPKTKR